ncbi:hypothetical protein ACFCVU_20015 [Peribacillus butanolivorans]|uniref:hypothetical protein n=1 Tax=Peribacillus butanolivorans TaxID=421767 RepID=UPI0035D70B12
MPTEKQLDYLEKIAIAKDEIRGQIVLEAIKGLEPDDEYYEKQRQKIAKYNRKITELTKREDKPG